MQSHDWPRSAGTADATTLDLDPGRFRFSLWRNVSITVWEAQITLVDADRVLEVSHRLNERLPQGRSQVLFVPQGVHAPEDAAAAKLVELYDTSTSGIVCFASILEGTGFWACAVRSKMTGMRIAAGNAMTLHVNNSVDEVVEWLPDAHLRHTGVALEASQLKTVLSRVRARGTRDEP